MSNLTINTTNSTKFNSSIITANLRSSVQMMSSKEIAELTGKRHDHLIRDIRSMLEQLDAPNLGHEEYQVLTDDRGYTSEILLNKDLTTCLVSGYNVQLRMAIIKRWNELEAQFLELVRPSYMIEDPIERAKKWIEEATAKKAIETKLIEAKQVIEVQQVDVDALERIASRKGSMTMRDAAKLLNMRQKDLRDWMLANKWTYSPYKDCYRPTSAHATAGHLALSANDYKPLVRVTWKGLVLLAKRLKVTLDTDNLE